MSIACSTTFMLSEQVFHTASWRLIMSQMQRWYSWFALLSLMCSEVTGFFSLGMWLFPRQKRADQQALYQAHKNHIFCTFALRLIQYWSFRHAWCSILQWLLAEHSMSRQAALKVRIWVCFQRFRNVMLICYRDSSKAMSRKATYVSSRRVLGRVRLVLNEHVVLISIPSCGLVAQLTLFCRWKFCKRRSF